MAGYLEIIRQDKWFSDKAFAFLAYLLASGEVTQIDVSDEEADRVFQRTKALAVRYTKVLLREYRNADWYAQYSPYACKPNDSRPGTPEAMLEIFRRSFPEGNPIDQEDWYTLSTAGDLFAGMRNAVRRMKQKPGKNKQYAQVLRICYFSPKMRDEEAIMKELDVCRSYYYRLKKMAISALADELWSALPARQVRLLTDAARCVI